MASAGPKNTAAGTEPRIDTDDSTPEPDPRQQWLRECAVVAVQAAELALWERDLVTGDGRWDDRMYRLRGLDPSDPRPISELRLGTVHPDDRGDAEAAAAAAAETGEPVDLEFRVVWPDGTVRWLLSRANRVRDAGGAIRRLVGTQWDITAAKQAELASRAKSEFLVRLSHDMRTPLNAVLGFAHLLLEDPSQPLSEAQKRCVRHIIASGDELKGLIERGSDLSAIEAGAVLPPPSVDPSTGLRQPSPLPDGAVTLVCIDDDPVSHMLLEKLASLRPEFVFEGATTAATGLALAARVRPRIVLIDLHLPDADGIQLLAMLRADPALADARLIAISASSMPGDIEAAERAGFAGYWVKPINVPRLLSALHRLATHGDAEPLAFAAVSAMHRVSYGA